MAKTSAQKSADYRAKDIEAYRAKKREYAKTPEQREKRKLYMRQWAEKNREKFNDMCRVSHGKKRNPEANRVRHLLYTYGITEEQFNGMLDAQGGICLICGSETPRGQKRWHVDHCHVTGRIRGLLCNMCNPRLGWYERYAESINAYLASTEAPGLQEN